MSKNPNSFMKDAVTRKTTGSTVIAKASIPMFVLPLIAFAVLVVTQGIMMLAAGAMLPGSGVGEAARWTHTPLLALWTAMLYHLLTVHALYYAPLYAWLLLVSAWARRAPILWVPSCCCAHTRSCSGWPRSISSVISRTAFSPASAFSTCCIATAGTKALSA